jgi:hypothetical protein
VALAHVMTTIEAANSHRFTVIGGPRLRHRSILSARPRRHAGRWVQW